MMIRQSLFLFCIVEKGEEAEKGGEGGGALQGKFSSITKTDTADRGVLQGQISADTTFLGIHIYLIIPVCLVYKFLIC